MHLITVGNSNNKTEKQGGYRYHTHFEVAFAIS
jgi:hypothetical protein